MEMFRMTDVLPLLGIPYPTNGQKNFYIKCPCCDEKPRDQHLNISLKKDVFRCPRCGVSGGIFDLYSLYTGVPRDKVYKTLLRTMGKGQTEQPKTVPVPHPPIVEAECPITDVDTRHATYTAFLSKLSLAQDHRENLLGRGLTDEEIVRLGYKTTPILGMSAIAKQLRSEGYYLAGVPGFYRKDTDEWSFSCDKRGILIPVRDHQGRIQGLQIRRDNTEKRKFRWVSSAELKDGCRAEGWTHLAGPITECLILTEGPMKADVIHALTGITVLAVPGVNTLTQLKITLEILRANGLSRIKTAFDMDFSTNQHVQNGFNSLLSLLNEMGFRYGTYLWDARYKGLDDYIWEGMMSKKRNN